MVAHTLMSRLDALLREAGVSVREQNRRGGPPPFTIRQWKAGNVTPRPEPIARLARALNLDVQTVADAVAETVAAARAMKGAKP
jgi:hypothetical protein